MPEPLILSIGGRAPELHDEAWVAPNAAVLGQVTLSAKASVWYGVTLRAEVEPIEIVLTGARIGAGSLIAAGAVVPQGTVVPPGSLVAGVPGKVRRELSADEMANNRNNAVLYQHLIELHRSAIE